MAHISIGYTLSSEEHSPVDLVAHARQAEEAGFEFLSISDHYFPWIDAQGKARLFGRSSVVYLRQLKRFPL